MAGKGKGHKKHQDQFRVFNSQNGLKGAPLDTSQNEVGGQAYDPATQQRPQGDREQQDHKHRTGQFTGKGEPPLMKK